ncbi:MAG: LysR family transcriptional regulator [Clostridium sp.]|nr:LysR family transcriptional regulator [Clostridium sp.]
MNLNYLRYFRVLAKLEHYTKAAEELSITQPSLSHAMSALEKELGTYLFEKDGRNVKLTKYGKIYYEYVERALRELEEGEKRVKELIGIGTGSVDLGYIFTLGPEFVPKLVNGFINEQGNEKVKFTFGQGTTACLLNDLKNEKYDIVFSSIVHSEEEIEFVPIMEEELVVIVDKEHNLAKKSSVDLAEISEYPFIAFSNKSGIRQIIDGLFEAVNVKPNIICEVEENNAIAGLVEVKYGISIVPKITALKYFNVKILPIYNPNHKRYIYMATLKNKYQSPTMKMFKNYVEEYCRKSNLT